MSDKKGSPEGWVDGIHEGTYDEKYSFILNINFEPFFGTLKNFILNNLR